MLHNHSDGSENKHFIMAKKHDWTTLGGKKTHAHIWSEGFILQGGIPRSHQNILVFGITLFCYYLIITNWPVTNYSRNY